MLLHPNPHAAPIRMGRITHPRRLCRYTARQHPSTWSSTMPADCMSAYTVVGPTKRNPALRSALDAASDSAVVAGISDAPIDLAPPADGSGRAQLWPHRHGTDAMSISLLRKR